MTRITLPIKDIIVKDRLRQELGDIDGLAASIERFGLIQPIVLNQGQQLIAGGRRYLACQKLGLAEVPVTYMETLTQDELHEMELEENLRRLDMTWQEECLSILEIHRLKKRRGALEGWTWNQRLAAEAFGMAVGTINYVLKVGEKLRHEKTLPDDQRKYWKYGSVNEAYRLGLLKEEEDRIQAELARRHRETANKGSDEGHAIKVMELVKSIEKEPDLLEYERQRYQSNPHNVIPFEEYWASKQLEAKQTAETIFLSRRVLHMNSLDYMNDESQRGRFDHIITDIPYGIDLVNLNQQNPHGGLADLDTVAEEHDVAENLLLIADFYPAAFRCTKEAAFVISFCDIMNWQFMYDCAVKAGFNVQRWPALWVKSQAMNQCAGYNFTKNFEPIMIARKPATTLVNKVQRSDFQADNDVAVNETGHKFAKPYEVTKWLTEAVSIEGQEILDPFAGRGSMTVQMLRMRRRVVAIELQETHYNALLENIKRLVYLPVNPNYQFK